MRRALATILLCSLCLAGCRSGGGSPTPASGAGGVPPPGPGIHQESWTLPGGDTQRYTLSVPDGYPGGGPVPLVLALHYGGPVTPFYGRNILEILVKPALEPLGAIIVAPDALDKGWDDARDEAAVLALLDRLQATSSLDPRRILVTGYSMGGVGTWYLAARHPERFTAAVAVAGRPEGAFDPRIPLYAIHSRQDEVMPLAPTEAAVTRLRAAGAKVELVVVEGLTHFQTERFVEPLRAAVPWIERVWAARP